jgi:hypothetical protein
VSAVVLSLAEAKRRRALPPRDRLSAQAEVRCGLVIMLERDREVAMTPAAARTFPRSLALLADSAEGASLPPELPDAEVRARLALLGDAVQRLDCGRGGVSDVMALVRQLTAEVRRG